MGRAEQSDNQQGLSSSYACLNYCDDSYLTSFVTPSSAGIVVNDGAIFTARQMNTTIYETEYTFTQSASWSSSNTNVATVDNSGFATGQNVGQTTIKATWDTYRVEPPLQPCGPYAPQQTNLPNPCGCSSFSQNVAPKAPLLIVPTVDVIEVGFTGNPTITSLFLVTCHSSLLRT